MDMEENQLADSLQQGENDEKDLMQVAKLEQELFVITKQLEESQLALVDATKQNSLLLSNNEQAKKLNLFHECEKQRDQLIVQRKELQNENSILNDQKNGLEIQVAKLINEKRVVSDNFTSLNKELNESKSHSVKLQMEIDEYQNDKHLIEYEKERWKQEKEILTQSKQWFMNEITERDRKLNQLRIDISNMEMNFARVKSKLADENHDLLKKFEELQKNFVSKDEELLKSKDQMQELIQERTTALNAMDSEIRSQSRLVQVYKESLESVNKELDELRNSEEQAQNLLKESEETVMELKREIEDIQNNFSIQLQGKDSEIKSFTDELAKANELLKIGARISSSDEDIANLSPAAAAAASLIKSGISLTAIYTEHCRVISELQKKEEENRRIEKYVQELVDELDAKAPYLREQREDFERAISEIERMKAQIDLLSHERQKLVNLRDSSERELAFTKAELVKYQRDHHNMAVQVQRLLYVIEKGKDGSNESEDETTEQRLFTDITELQEKNMELRMKLNELEEQQDEIVKSVSNSEIERLTKLLDEANNELNRIKAHQNKQSLLINELEHQRDNYKHAYEELETNSALNQDRNARRSLDKIESESIRWKSQAERLEEKLNTLSDDRRNMEKLYLERIDQQMEQIGQLRASNAKLENDLFYQKKNQELIIKQHAELELAMKQKDGETSKWEVRYNTLQSRFDELSRQILEKQHELSSLKINNRSLEEQLAVASSNVLRFSIEIEALRQTKYNSERMALTLESVQATLQRVEAEKTQNTQGQLEFITLERDNLKNLCENLKEQSEHFTNELKLKANKLESERDQARLEIESLQLKLSETETFLIDLREHHDQLTKQLAEVHSSDSNIESCKKEIQQLRNKNSYLEKQVSELQEKTDEWRTKLQKKERELDEITKLSGNMENVINQQNEFLKLEQARLQSLLDHSQTDLKASRGEEEALRQKISQLELRHLERDRLDEDTNQEHLKKVRLLEQQLIESQQQLVDKSSIVFDLETQLNNVQQQLDGYKHQAYEFSNEVKSLKDSLLSKESEANDISNKFSAFKEEHQLITLQHTNTINSLSQDKLRLKDEVDKLNIRDQEKAEKTQLLYDEIQKLTQHINTASQLQEFSKGEPTGAASKETQSFEQVLKYLRMEKQKEMELRMNAELELHRIQAQADIDHERISSLEIELEKMKREVEANTRSLFEKEQIINELSLLRQVQEHNVELNKQCDEMRGKLTLAETKLKEALARCLQLNSEKSNLDARVKSNESELEAHKKEITSLRDRNEKAMAMVTKYTGEKQVGMIGELEKNKQQLTQANRDLQFYKERAEKLTLTAAEFEAKIAKINEEKLKLEEARKGEEDKFIKARGLARQFREECRKLQTEKDAIQKELDAAKVQIEELNASTSLLKSPAITTGWPTDISSGASDSGKKMEQILRDKISEVSKLKSENAELSTKLSNADIRISQLEAELNSKLSELEAKEKEVNEAAEIKYRMDSITSMLGQNQKRIQTLKEENDQLKKQIENSSTRKRCFDETISEVLESDEIKKRSRLDLVAADELDILGGENIEPDGEVRNEVSAEEILESRPEQFSQTDFVEPDAIIEHSRNDEVDQESEKQEVDQESEKQEVFVVSDDEDDPNISAELEGDESIENEDIEYEDQLMDEEEEGLEMSQEYDEEEVNEMEADANEQIENIDVSDNIKNDSATGNASSSINPDDDMSMNDEGQQ